jgi:hypothetical protein
MASWEDQQWMHLNHQHSEVVSNPNRRYNSSATAEAVSNHPMAAAVAAVMAAMAAHLAKDHLNTSLNEQEAAAQPVDQDDGNNSRANIHSL